MSNRYGAHLFGLHWRMYLTRYPRAMWVLARCKSNGISERYENRDSKKEFEFVCYSRYSSKRIPPSTLTEELGQEVVFLV